LVSEGRGLPREGEKGARVWVPGKGEAGTGCRLAVLGAGGCGRLPDGSGVWTDGWPDWGSLCPVEERRARGSPFALRITSFPGAEKLGQRGGLQGAQPALRCTRARRKEQKGGDWREKKPNRPARNRPSR